MKKILLTIIMLLPLINVSAEETDKTKEKIELRNNAQKIKIKYEPLTELVDSDSYIVPEEYADDSENYELYNNFLKVNILNLSDKYYAKVTNNLDNESFLIKNEDESNVSTFDWKKTYDIATLSVEIYTNENTSFPGELIRKMTVRLPRYNVYSDYELCDKIPNSFICKKYTDYKNVSESEFVKIAKREIA